MKNKATRGLAALMCLVLMLSVFTACKGSKDNKESTSAVTGAAVDSWSQGIPSDTVELTKEEIISLVKEALGDSAADFDGDLKKLSAEQLAKVEALSKAKGYTFEIDKEGVISIMKTLPLVALTSNEVVELVKSALGDDAAKFTGDLSALSAEQLAKVEDAAAEKGYYILTDNEGNLVIKREDVATEEEISEAINNALGEEATTFNGDMASLSPSQQEAVVSNLEEAGADQKTVDSFWDSLFGTKADAPKVTTTVPKTTVINKPSKADQPKPIVTTERITSPHASTDRTTTKKTNAVANAWIKNCSEKISAFKACDATSDGGFVAVGATVQNEKTFAIISKYDSNGKEKWAHRFEGDLNSSFEAVKVLSDDSVLAVGWTNSTDLDAAYACSGTIEGLAVIYNSNGRQEAIRLIGGSDDDYICSVEQAPDGGVYLGGYTRSHDGTFDGIAENATLVLNAYLIKYSDSSLSSFQWGKFMASSKACGVYGISCADNGDVFASYVFAKGDGSFASIKDVENGLKKTLVTKYSADGADGWSKLLYGSGRTELPYILATNDGGCVLAGLCTASGIENIGTFAGTYNGGSSGTADGVVLKLNSGGTIFWQTMFIGFENDFITGVVPVAAGYAVSGYSSSTNRDFVMMPGFGDNDTFVYAISPTGMKQSMSAIGGSGADKGMYICALSDGNVGVCGSTSSSDQSFEGVSPAAAGSARAFASKFVLTTD